MALSFVASITALSISFFTMDIVHERWRLKRWKACLIWSAISVAAFYMGMVLF